MAKPITQRFDQRGLEVSEDGTTWRKLCGMVGVTITRSTNMDTSEVPQDCDDESLPMDIAREPRSQEVTVSATGVWAQQSHEEVLDWWYGAESKQVRIGNLNAASGDTEYEKGPCFLTNVTNQRTKGQRVTSNIELAFDGLPTRTVKA